MRDSGDDAEESLSPGINEWAVDSSSKAAGGGGALRRERAVLSVVRMSRKGKRRAVLAACNCGCGWSGIARSFTKSREGLDMRIFVGGVGGWCRVAASRAEQGLIGWQGSYMDTVYRTLRRNPSSGSGNR